MSTSSIGLRQRLTNIVWPAIFATGAIAAYFTYPMWMPHAHAFLAFVKNQKEIAAEPESVVPRGTPDTLTLSPTALEEYRAGRRIGDAVGLRQNRFGTGDRCRTPRSLANPDCGSHDWNRHAGLSLGTGRYQTG